MFSKNILFFVFKNRKQKTVFVIKYDFFFSRKYKTVLKNSYQTNKSKFFCFSCFYIKKSITNRWMNKKLISS